MCAQIIDARVKQKTGTAADFAGYQLLAGEIALVRTSPNGPVWNFKVGPGNFDSLDWSLQNPGAAQKADTSTVFPVGVPGLYIPTESGTYEGLTVDLSAGYTQLIWDGASLVDVVFPIDLSGYATMTDLASRQGSLYRVGYYDFNKQLDTNTGELVFNGTRVYLSDYIKINQTEPIYVSKGPNTGNVVHFFDANKEFISGVSLSSDGSAMPVPGAEYAGINISTSLSTRMQDVLFFSIFQRGSLPNEYPPQTSTTDSSNLYDPANGYDDHYVYSDGRTDAGATSPRTDYAMGFLILDPSETQLSYRRLSTLGQLGAFYDENMTYISGIGGVGGQDTGTITIPSGAAIFLFNVSNNPNNRQAEKDGFTLVYGEDIPENIPAKQVVTVGGRSIYTSYRHPLFNKRGVLQGDSIMRYSGTPQDTNGGFGMRALRDMGSILVENYAIGGTTIAQRSAEPTERNPLVIRYTDMNPDADFVIIAAGTNDWNYDWTPIGTASDDTPNTLYGALNILLEGLLEMYMGKPIVWSLPIKRNFQLTSTPDAVNGLGLTLQEYSDIIAERCQFWGVYTFDMGKACGINPFIPSHVTPLIPDGTHPNAAGSQLMANALQGFLRTLTV